MRSPTDHFTTSTPTTPNRRRDAIDFLMGRINYERTPSLPYAERHLKLDRMRQLLTRLGKPDAGLPIVHVAGTKGKGSTSALIAKVLQAAGYQTGLFSSPHLHRIEERFAVDGQPCSAEELIALVDQLRPIVRAMDAEAMQRDRRGEVGNDLRPTYFELTTALALMHFAQRQVDVALLEVGLGGRLDSTNVCMPVATVISSISLDHTKQLGNTLAKIAAEKAGIIKPGVPLLCGLMEDEPRRVIASIARNHGCRLMEAGHDFHYRYRQPQKLDISDQLGQLDFVGRMAGEEIELSNIPLRLLGEHQAANAALALATTVELRLQGWSISDEAMHQGLTELALPARMEVTSRRPTVVLDVAHNVASAQALIQSLTASFDCHRRVLVLAVSRDKDVRGMLQVLLPHFGVLIATQYQDNPRAVPACRLAELASEQRTLADAHVATASVAAEIHEQPLPADAWQLAQQIAGLDQLICITGSFFIAAELRPILLATPSEHSVSA